MKSKRIIMALIVTIMLVSAVACGTADKAKESKTTDETAKEVITASTENITQSVTELTTKKKEEETDSHGHRYDGRVTLEFDNTFKLSEETCKNISDYFDNKVFIKGDIIDLSQIQYNSNEYESMQLFGFGMSNAIPHAINSVDYTLPFEYKFDESTEINIYYDSNGIIIKIYSC